MVVVSSGVMSDVAYHKINHFESLYNRNDQSVSFVWYVNIVIVIHRSNNVTGIQIHPLVIPGNAI